MAVIDAILFFNELDLLEIRVNELHNVIDRFLVIQSNKTFSNQSKKLYTIEDNKRLLPFKKQIIFFNVTDMPSGFDPWAREKHQRNMILEGLKHIKSKLSDRVLISDIDEIPRANAVAEAARFDKIAIFQLRYFYYFINVRGITLPWWPLLRMATHKDLIPEPQKIRDLQDKDSKMITISDAGWHFSYLGGKNRIKEKIAAFSHHTEYNLPQFTDDVHLEKVLREKTDLFNRRMPIFSQRLKIGQKITWKQVPLDDTYPSYILRNKRRFDYLIAK